MTLINCIWLFFIFILGISCFFILIKLIKEFYLLNKSWKYRKKETVEVLSKTVKYNKLYDDGTDIDHLIEKDVDINYKGVDDK